MSDYHHKLDCGCRLHYSAAGELELIERCERHKRPQKASEGGKR